MRGEHGERPVSGGLPEDRDRAGHLVPADLEPPARTGAPRSRPDRELIALLQQDATQSYAALGEAVLKAAGVIRRATVEVDPAALGTGVLAYVLLDTDAWMGDAPTRQALQDIAAVEEAHIIAGPASILVKVRTSSTEALQQTLRALHQVDGVTSTQTVVVLESFFERPLSVV